MPSQNFIEACLTFLVIEIGMYVIYSTFGLAMSQLYRQFTDLIPSLSLGTGWATVATNTLTGGSFGNFAGWHVFYFAVIPVSIAVGVWVVRRGMVQVQYSRGFN